MNELQPLPSTSLSTSSALPVPALIEDAGDTACRRFIEFFTAHIRNRNTRQAYGRAVAAFMAWADRNGLALLDVEPVHVAAYIEAKQAEVSAATIKQHLAAIRALFDYLVVGQVLPFNPAHAVRGPKLSRQTGTTPVLTPEEARRLLEQPDASTLPGLRDRAMIGLMLYSFARVSATVAAKVSDYYPEGDDWIIRLGEKGGKERRLPVHHEAKAFLDAWISEAGIGQEKASPLFRAFENRQLSDRPLSRQSANDMIDRHASAAGIDGRRIGCHSMRGTGITTFLKRGGSLEAAQRIAGHADIKTTKLYDRRDQEIARREVERIQF